MDGTAPARGTGRPWSPCWPTMRGCCGTSCPGCCPTPTDREGLPRAEVRLKLWEKREQYDPERSSPATWLTVLCRNAAVDHLRSASTPQR